MADRARSLLIRFLGDSSGLKGEAAGVTTSLSSIRTSISEAEGASGKFKAAAGGAFQYAKEHAGQLAMAGGTALVAFGIKAVHAFEDTAKAAIDLGAATGLSTEAASEWIAVGDDVKVSAEQLTSGIGKIAKTLDDTKWAEYGIQTRDAAGKARSANDILIDALSTLSAIKDETERARVGNELFGKGWTNLAPLIGHTADEYRNMLGAVSDGQRVTDAEARKAERMRLAEDALADAVHDLTLRFGEWASEAAPALEMLAKGIGVVDDFRDGVKDAITWLAKSDIQVPTATGHLGAYVDEEKAAAQAAAEMAERVASLSTEVEGLGHDLPESTAKQADLTEKTRDGAAAQESVTAAIQDRLEAEQRLREEALRQIDAGYNYMLQVLDTNEALAEYNAELDDGALKGDDLTRATDEARQSMVDAATAYADTTGAAQGTNAWISAVIASLGQQAAALDPSSLLYQAIQGYIAQLKNIPTYVETTFGIKGPGAVTIGPAPKVRGATGGIVTRPTVALIGEAGPEAVIPLNRTPGASPLPTSTDAGPLVVNVRIDGSVYGVDQLNRAIADGVTAGLAERDRQARGNR